MTTQIRYYDQLKRGLDILGSGIGLVVLAPIIGVVGAAVRVKLGSPVVFKQRRPGRGGKIFTLYKFRSMLDVDTSQGKLTNEQRITSFGRKIRALSLDELPSLVNVLRGDMSLVGPRPLREEYLAHYSSRQARRHDVSPGVTGLAQVRGRNALSWEKRFDLDVEYVDARSIKLDLQILLETLLQVFRRSGIEGDGMATMSAFVGTAPVDELTEEPLSEEWLPTRVQWLDDPKIRKGISISFKPNIEDTSRWFDSARKNPARRDWVYLNEAGEPVAMAGLDGVGTPDLILYIYVGSAMHGNGYGSMVMPRLIYRAKTYGGYRLHLDVKKSNAVAIHMYEKFGFVRIYAPEGSDPGKYYYVLQLKDEK